jgi:Rps23 Pro-64 3,4-dihydroxylase Tpa1-like proline 4-hydroxylase
MNESFETLIASYIEHKVGISDHFLSNELANHLKKHLLALNAQNLLLAAGIGNADKLLHNTALRSDTIYWLDKKHNNEYETAFLLQIEDFILYLNTHCYTGITGYEFHFALYEKGSFYVKHLDQFQNNSSRQFSMISYLNADWEAADGGELLIHQTDNNQTISPIQGKTVFFKSNELPHEVLLTQTTRMSITGWLKRD